MNLLERSISLLAPHTCLVCKREGSPLCPDCAGNNLRVAPPLCYKCGYDTPNSATCLSCLAKTRIEHLWVGTEYADIARQIVALLKFQRAKAASEVIADWLNRRLPPLPDNMVVTAVPTATNRVRLRGYDQARLIARHFARKRGLSYQETLWRIKNTRQVGANRAERFMQLEGAFTVRKSNRLAGKHLLLIDDVLTTGATLQTAAYLLHRCGTAHIDAAVFAYKA